MRAIAILAIVLLLGAAAPPELPGWMAGAWATRDGARWSDEFWTPPRAGLMIGAGRSGEGERLKSWEAMRIERKPDGSLSFFGQPNGAPAVEFPLNRSSAQMVEFANPAHDYPQRIRYWREGRTLRAEVALIDGSQAVRWSFAPMGASPWRARPARSGPWR